MTPAVAAQLRPQVNVSRLVWLALVAAVPIYVVIAYLLTHGQAPRPIEPSLRIVFLVMPVISAIQFFLVPRFYPPAALVQQAMSDGTSAAPGTAIGAPPPSDELRQLSDEERKLVLAGRLFPTATIMRLAGAEAVSVMGFVLTFLTYTVEPAIYYGVPALALLALGYPRLEPFLERIEALRSQLPA